MAGGGRDLKGVLDEAQGLHTGSILRLHGSFDAVGHVFEDAHVERNEGARCACGKVGFREPGPCGLQEVEEEGRNLDPAQDAHGTLVSSAAIRTCFWISNRQLSKTRGPLNQEGAVDGVTVYLYPRSPGSIKGVRTDPKNNNTRTLSWHKQQTTVSMALVSHGKTINHGTSPRSPAADSSSKQSPPFRTPSNQSRDHQGWFPAPERCGANDCLAPKIDRPFAPNSPAGDHASTGARKQSAAAAAAMAMAPGRPGIIQVAGGRLSVNLPRR